MTRAELRLAVTERTASGYSLAAIENVLNEGLRLFSTLTLAVERRVLLKLQPNTTWYTLLTLLPDFLVPLQVRCYVDTNPAAVAEWDVPLWDAVLFDEAAPDAQTVMTRVRPARLQDLDALSPVWQNERNATVRRYGCLGVDQFFISPAPSAEGTTLELVYAAMAAPITQDFDRPEIPEAHHQALIQFALSTLPLRFGGAEMGDSKAEFQRFLDHAKSCAELVRARSLVRALDRMPFELRDAPKPTKGRAK